jgi:hypothetical protein
MAIRYLKASHHPVGKVVLTMQDWPPSTYECRETCRRHVRVDIVDIRGTRMLERDGSGCGLSRFCSASRSVATLLT